MTSDGRALSPEEDASRSMRLQTARLVRRRAAPTPFVPHGLAPAAALGLLILFGLAPFAFGSVESVTERTARRALDEIDANWAHVKVSGQWVTLEGAPPSSTDASEAVEAVRKAKAATLFGAARPVTRVSAKWSEGSGLGMAPPPQNNSTPATPVAAKPVCDRAMIQAIEDAIIGFDTASAVIDRASGPLLDQVAQATLACSGVLRIEGYTDDEGSTVFNERLSVRRADAVRMALMQRGVPELRVSVEGFGASRPLATNRTEDGRERNRRIEMRLIPIPN